MLLSLVSTLAAAVSSTGLLAPTTISDPSLALSGHDGYASLIDTENTLEMGFYAQTQDFTGADRDIEVESGVSTLLSKVGRTQLADVDFAPGVGGAPVFTYYYEATQEEGIVESVRPLRNDWESVIFMIRELEDHSGFNNYYTINPCLAFLRSVSKSYTGEAYYSGLEWRGMAGDYSISANIKTSLNAGNHGLDPAYFFARFSASKCDFNIGYFGAFDDSTVPSGQPFAIDLMDVMDSSYSFDLLHFAAAADCFYQNTGAVSEYGSPTFFGGDPNWRKHLGSWGGDLQTLAAHPDAQTMVNNGNGRTPFYNFATASWSPFSFEDFYADIDAANIARMYLNEGVELSDAMLDYYTKLKNGNINRYSEFIDSLIAEIAGALNKTDLEKAQMFQEKVGTMLDLKLSGGSFIDGPGSGATLDFKYKLMASNWPTVSERKRIGFSFFNHVLQKTDYPSSVKYGVWELAS